MTDDKLQSFINNIDPLSIDIKTKQRIDIAREEGRITGLQQAYERINNRIIVAHEVRKYYPDSKQLEGCGDCLERVKSELLELINKKETSNG